MSVDWLHYAKTVTVINFQNRWAMAVRSSGSTLHYGTERT